MAKDQIRLLLVEDVPQVAQYVRGLLNAQSAIKLLDVLVDGSKAAGQIGQLRPDVVIVDALLQGRIKGLQLVDQLFAGGRRAADDRPDRTPASDRAGPRRGGSMPS